MNTFAFATANLNPIIISFAVLETMPPDAGLHNSALIVGIELGLLAWHTAALTAKPSTTTLRETL
jgi:hypothetical protein